MTELPAQFATGSLDLLLRVFLIVVPIMVVLELFEGTRAFRAVVRAWAGSCATSGLDERPPRRRSSGSSSGSPTAAGVIVRDVRRHDLGRRQVFIMSVFLSMVHAIVEDSLIFIALGASVFWVVVYRIAVGGAGHPRAHGAGRLLAATAPRTTADAAAADPSTPRRVDESLVVP